MDSNSNEAKLISTSEEHLQNGQWVYTPDYVPGSGGRRHNIFQYDNRINYSTHFGHDPVFYRIIPPKVFGEDEILEIRQLVEAQLTKADGTIGLDDLGAVDKITTKMMDYMCAKFNIVQAEDTDEILKNIKEY